MKFTIRRASQWGNEVICCDEAKRDSITCVETRTYSSPEVFDKNHASREGKWLSVGQNHRINEKGYITRDNGTIDVQCIEINTLDELIEFCEKYGDVIIGDCIWNPAYKEILIYDDYIE